jgi:hypothetical protein
LGLFLKRLPLTFFLVLVAVGVASDVGLKMAILIDRNTSPLIYYVYVPLRARGYLQANFLTSLVTAENGKIVP